MNQEGRRRRIARFGVYEVDLEAGELRRKGERVKLQDKPFRTLAALLERSGEVVARDELRRQLWPADTFVEFDDNLNAAVKRLREALGDSAESPRYIETVPRRGYRFIPPVEWPGAPVEEAETKLAPEPVSQAESSARAWTSRRWKIALALLLLVAVAGVALWRLRQGGNAGPGRLMLAVLPFKNLSGDARQEYVSDGMTEELTAQLGRLAPARLGVIARTSVMRYKNSTEDVRQAGRELGVAYVLEGSVRRGEPNLFVTAQLIRVADQTHLWAETYERRFEDVFAVQRDVARRVSESLALELLPSEKAALARASTVNTEAYDSYLRGRYELRQGTEAGFREALASFEAAARLDPRYGMAYVGVAMAHLALAEYRFESVDESRAKAGAAMSQGLAMDQSIPDLYLLQADTASRAGSSAAAIEEAYRRAISLDPNNAEGHLDYALYLRKASHYDGARREGEKARELDPASPWVLTCVGWIELSAKDHVKARSALLQALRLDPNFPAALYFMARVEEAQGDERAASTWLEKAVNVSGRTPKYLHALAVSYAQMGRRDQAAKLLQELRQAAGRRYVEPEYIRDVEAMLDHAPR